MRRLLLLKLIHSTFLAAAMHLAISLIPGISLGQSDAPVFELSIGGAIGYAPVLTHGNTKNNGAIVGVFGDLQIYKMIGRIQYTSALASTVSNGSFDRGSALHGSIGVNVELTDRLQMPVMLAGGASFLTYTTSIFGGKGDTFQDVSPQIGIVITPYYLLTDNLALQGGLRYFKGFKGSDESEEINLMDISVGVRYTFWRP
jgi:hypothetical protein